MKIHSSVIPTDWFDAILHPTLDSYLKGEDLSSSTLVRSEVSKLHRDCLRATPDQLAACLQRRQDAVIRLFESIMVNGYTGSMVYVWFDDDGYVHLHDGYHRISILKYLNIAADINVTTEWHDAENKRGRDFPLVDRLLPLHPPGKWLYQPVNDHRVRDFRVARTDSPIRLDYIANHLIGDSVLDIGCSEGFFSRSLAKQGYQVSAIDRDPGKVAVTRYLGTLNGVSVECQHGRWEDVMNGRRFDNVLFLSVFHNTIHDQGTDVAFEALRQLRGRARRVFFEVPRSDEPQWRDYRGPPVHGFDGDQFIHKVEDATGMVVKERWNGPMRPIMLLEGKDMSEPKRIRGIGFKEWQKHNVWESNWWSDCRNTFEEQLKQDRYAKYMRLDQFAAHRKGFNLQGKSVIDVGGGPVSLLLRCWNVPRAVVIDPCTYPKWVMDRYKHVGIKYVKERAEESTITESFDEAWIYNCLQHVQDPRKVVDFAKRVATVVRVCEHLNLGPTIGHPHKLTKDELDRFFGKSGLVADWGGVLVYYGVFRYGRKS